MKIILTDEWEALEVYVRYEEHYGFNENEYKFYCEQKDPDRICRSAEGLSALFG